MSVQRWDIERGAPAWVASKGEFVKHADHARIVAEAGAAVFAFHPEWTVTGMCDSDCLACRRLTELITEREKGYEEGKADAEQAHAAALAGMYELGKADGHLLGEEKAHRDSVIVHEGAAESRGYRRGLAAAPRTLTADDPGYHSQRCLHCDHIRATHTLTAHGCIGHALPGRPGADCPCAEFIHDGGAS